VKKIGKKKQFMSLNLGYGWDYTRPPKVSPEQWSIFVQIDSCLGLSLCGLYFPTENSHFIESKK